ncbi:hypothetical protein CVIRNUC_002415 [Coccomyxa viridis]|uniref:Deoxyhypusine synthase n=1 Tax=Coccomyxa viridis TaxID=1274662 RepID=A0AAV1HWF5_9CHLO|nr:hypothetical protein CVIRNUC_002415 [Coccomyxa viridis]
MGTEGSQSASTVPHLAAQAVLAPSQVMPENAATVQGWDFDHGCTLDGLLQSFLQTGFQATAFGRAVAEVNRMLDWRLSDEPEDGAHSSDLADRQSVRAKIFLGFTSNLISSGVREHIRYLVQHRMVDVLVTTAGGVEEDLIKCLGPTYTGDFHLRGADLRKRGLNRVGNLLVPNSNYCAFEDWIMPILDALQTEQEQEGARWTPSKVVARLGKEINDESSVCYWCWKNGIPIFCPALTDGSLGDMLFFHSYKSPGLIIDIVDDIRQMNDAALKAAPRKTGIIILGGGVAKHHICNANLMKNGADYAVFINTAQEFDGSDSGAQPDEAVSWGKIRADATPVKVSGDATILLPLLVSQTFAKQQTRQQQNGVMHAGSE